VHRCYWYIKKWHTTKSKCPLLHSTDETLLPQATLHAPSVTRPAAFCILKFRLCSTFLTPSYKSQLAVIPLIAIQCAYFSTILNSTNNYANNTARCTVQDLGSHSTVTVTMGQQFLWDLTELLLCQWDSSSFGISQHCYCVTGTAVPVKHQQPVTQ
jgi:hypothetical protein